MWWFKKKHDPLAAIPMPDVGFELKSITLAQAQPKWSLFARRQERWSIGNAINEGYDESTIVYACVEKRAKLIASVPWCVKKKGKDEDGNDTWLRDDTSPLNDLLKRPNPNQSLYELMYSVSQYLDLAGSAFVTKVKAGVTANLPRQLWVMQSQHMEIRPGRVRLVDSFEHIHADKIVSTILPEDMIHFRMPNPSSPYWGQPVLKAAAKATDVDREAGEHQKVSLQNRSLSDISVELPPGATPEQAQAVRDKLHERNSGPANARKPIVSSGKVTMLGQTAVEMDFVASRRATWTEICAAFGMSLANLGMTEAVNLANADAMNKALWENTIIPQLELMKRQLNHQLAGDFGNDIKIDYDLSNVEALQEKRSDKLDAMAKLFAVGVPFNEINERLELGFKEREGGDISYIPSGLIPANYDLGLDDGSNEEDGTGAYGSNA